jgi:hypothetical protein
MPFFDEAPASPASPAPRGRFDLARRALRRVATLPPHVLGLSAAACFLFAFCVALAWAAWGRGTTDALQPVSPTAQAPAVVHPSSPATDTQRPLSPSAGDDSQSRGPAPSTTTAPAPQPARSAVRPPRSAASCSPPYHVDANGVLHFKAECL